MITNSDLADLPEIFRLYKLATDFQKEKFPSNLWPEFDNEFITADVVDKRQFKLLIDNKIACIWTITFSDQQIWEERDNNSSIYIHRIATNPDFRGNNFMQKIVEWSRKYARTHNKQFIRMDTCGHNVALINHYSKCGFNYLGMKKLKNTSELPKHYENADVCFFEMELK